MVGSVSNVSLRAFGRIARHAVNQAGKPDAVDESIGMDELQAFLFQYVDSYEVLEVLLLLQQDAREWAAESIAARLNISTEATDEALSSLEKHGLAARSGAGYVYRPSGEVLDAGVQTLAREYDNNRIAIIAFMTKNAVERMRTDAIRGFADSFRLRGPKKKDG
jgi:hypothetical protein